MLHKGIKKSFSNFYLKLLIQQTCYKQVIFLYICIHNFLKPLSINYYKFVFLSYFIRMWNGNELGVDNEGESILVSKD